MSTSINRNWTLGKGGTRDLGRRRLRGLAILPLMLAVFFATLATVSPQGARGADAAVAPTCRNYPTQSIYFSGGNARYNADVYYCFTGSGYNSQVVRSSVRINHWGNSYNPRWTFVSARVVENYYKQMPGGEKLFYTIEVKYKENVRAGFDNTWTQYLRLEIGGGSVMH
jgi:hypothetical protein